jgi:hypothetical protein
MERERRRLEDVTRRHFFTQAGFGIGAMALSSLRDRGVLGAQEEGAVAGSRATHRVPKAKNVIFLFQVGAPSQVDLFDDKPKLRECNGQKIPEEFVKNERFAFIRGVPNLLGSPWSFARHGPSGAELSELLPQTASIADEIAIVKTVHTTSFNHAPAQIMMNSGHPLIGRPSMGSWLTYGIGSENANLPGFVVLVSGESNPDGGKACWASGFLPTEYQGVELRSQGDPVLYLSNPEGVTAEARRRSLDTPTELPRAKLRDAGDPEIATRIKAFEMAYRMQASVPELMDLSKEPKSVHEMYGTEPGKASFANNCLLARRLVERGVRFVQLYHRGWDHHGGENNDIVKGLSRACRDTDQAGAALVRDLKQRGLLESTLVIWGGEFGRTPMIQDAGSADPGRDHHVRAFTMWFAGGGIRPGVTIGKTDELGYSPIEDPVEVHDLHATLLHLLGIEHTRLTYRFQGRDYRLTDVFGKVVPKLIA